MSASKSSAPSSPSLSQCRQNFHGETETAINNQINMELNASFVYHSMAAYFDRDDVSLPGFAKFFEKQSKEEREHADKLMKYQNKRGGRVIMRDIAKPPKDEWGSALDALQTSLGLEKTVNQSLLNMHALASQHNDPHLTNYLEDEFLEEQVKSIKELGDMITQLKRAGASGLGEYLFDKELSE